MGYTVHGASQAVLPDGTAEAKHSAERLHDNPSKRDLHLKLRGI